MTRHEINNKYFDWMCHLVSDQKYAKRSSYKKLLTYLHNVEFVYIIGQDGNRYEDGIDLRYRFGYEYGIPIAIITTYLDDRPCSILEMLIALSLRCEEHIMDNPDIGDRTGRWFWGMISNLGLDSMTDSNFDIDYANEVIDRFLNRKYDHDGEGGLVTIHNCRYDMRSIEIWYQMMWYLDSVLKGEER